MDEPFGALDINTRLFMQDFLIDIWSKFNNTIVFVTHDIPEAVYLADEIWIMESNPGRIVDRIFVNNILPGQRNKSVKRQKNFVDLVHLIEDKMSRD